MPTETVLDLPAITDKLNVDDVLYILRGTGTDRDKQIQGSAIIPSVLLFPGSVNFSGIMGDVVVLIDPRVDDFDETLSVSNYLVTGRRLIVVNQDITGTWKITISGSISDIVLGGETGIYISDGTSFHKTNAPSIPTGTIQMFAGATIPTGWLLCDGTSYLRSNYSTLFSILGGAGSPWGVADDTHFYVPDMRGVAPAGVGTSSGYTQNETVALGTKYNDQAQGHNHELSNDGVSVGLEGIYAGFVSGMSNGEPAVLITMNEISDGTNGTPRIGNVTKGKTVGVNFIIKI